MHPRSRLLFIGCFALVALVCARLGMWQLHRLQERRAMNRAALAERSKTPLDLEPGDTAADSVINRRVRARGHYDPARDVVLRGRAYQGVPGVEIVSPLVSESGTGAVLVNRGFVPTPDAVTVSADSFREPGTVRVEGIALPISSGGGGPATHNNRTTWANLDLALLRQQFPYPISPVYLRQSPDSMLPRFPRRLDPPPLDDGPHLSYAIQWFAFSAMAVVFGIVISRQSGERRL